MDYEILPLTGAEEDYIEKKIGEYAYAAAPPPPGTPEAERLVFKALDKNGNFFGGCTVNVHEWGRAVLGVLWVDESCRGHGLGSMLMIQAESQLRECYGDDGRTIIGNCDTYVYLGGNDVETAKMVSARSNMPLCRILEMPIGTNWVFRRGSKPVNGRNFDLEAYLKELKFRRGGDEVR